MNGFLLALLLTGPAAAEPRKSAEPLPAKPPPDEYRVVVDDSAEPKEEEAPAPHGKPGVKRHGLGRLVSVDAKERRIVLEHEDGVEETFTVPDGARLTFAPDERTLKLDQLRRGDAVSYAVDGGKTARLHLDLCGEGSGDDDVFAPPRRNRRGRQPPPQFEDDGPEYPQADEPDVPMYQSEPPEPPPAPKKAPAKK
ncbi:hypothetical protein EPO15_04200 [bacterium]|nr:MAG: hypothetical protein EPO15_04200 [bacterium]